MAAKSQGRRSSAGEGGGATELYRLNAVAIVAVGVLMGCHGGRGVLPPLDESKSSRVKPTAVPDLRHDAPMGRTPFAHDPLWQQAGEGRALDLHRLANQQGAAGLLEGVFVGGAIGLTALSALPYAEDAEVGLGPVCELLLELPASQLQPALRSVHAIATQPPEAREQLAIEGWRRCQLIVVELAKRAGLALELRDLAISTGVMLAEHLDAAR